MYSKKDIKKQLKKMGAPRDSVVLMHTSLRSIGDVEGGACGLLDTLIDYFCAKGGLLCVPTHTWDNLGNPDVYTLDMTLTESNLGAFSVAAAAKDPRGVRSENPTHSMVVFGERAKAESFIRGEEMVLTPTAPDSCYGKLFRMGGYVLLVGVSHNKNTYLHCVDEMLERPNRMSGEEMRVTVRRATGEVIERPFYLYETDYTEDISWRFHQYETAFRYHGAIRDGFLGNAPTQLCSAVKMKETVERIVKQSGGVDPLAEEEPIPPKWYC